MGTNFSQQVKIWFSEIFTGVIFTVGQSWIRVLAAVWLKAERMSRIVYIERWQSQFFIPRKVTSYPAAGHS